MDKKVIILDFDGTVYSGEHKFDNVPKAIEENRRKFFPRITDNEYNMLLTEFPEFLNVTSGRKITLAMWKMKDKFPQLDIDTKDFFDWQNNSRYEIVLDPTLIADIDYINNLAINHPTYIVSNSSPNHLLYYMEVLGLNPKLFKDIVSNQFLQSDPSKEHHYKDILDKENCKPSQFYVFGDSVEADLIPAQNLGMNTIYIDNATLLKNEIEKVLK